jgi:hypothetical protein
LVVLFLILDTRVPFRPHTSPNIAHATHYDGDADVAGWAWSGIDANGDSVVDGGAGWISFSSTNCDTDGNGQADTQPPAPAGCPTAGTPIPPYAVTIDEGQSGTVWAIKGYAWAGGANEDGNLGTVGGLGWIRFDPPISQLNTAPEPSDPNVVDRISARVNILTAQVYGWVRACSIFVSDCDGAIKPASERGNWDGWIKLSCTGGSCSPSYGVTVDVNTGQFFGYAWGGGDFTDGDPFGLGWIQFDLPFPGGVDFTGQFNRPPVCTTPINIFFANEDAAFKTFPVITSGVCFDPDGDALTVDSLTPPTNGVANIINSGQDIEYRPNAGFVGTDSFTFRVTDARGLSSNIATVNVPVYDCGNDVLDPGEQCDTNQFGGETCRSQGGQFQYVGGDLTCTNDVVPPQSAPTSNNCRMETTQCRTYKDIKIKED